ncbi:hypothetical protein EHQ31_09350 [Leptospira montravelensis]|uniref:Uncharacterized protein n=1 Tax=Leptospira montravelensis TaxID=2484961 RepID=A0ABY2LQT1_9LEPT|nr:hypothetical protein [Leptospira montravelensis]TGK78669.1 hypothetical protein EHQ19_16400 [Leptospira montravelensis]TGL02373.1 hypothetical protein EHQ31_09350 [Leptospira montravelensis]
MNEVRSSTLDIKKNKYNKLHKKTEEIRTKIFINSIHLGKLTQYLLNAQLAFWDDIRLEADEEYAKYYFTDENRKKAFYASEQIDNASKWIIENMGTDKTYIDFELNPKDLENILNIKNQQIEEMFKPKE